MEDLWPDDIGKAELITPLKILKEQAALLGQKTQNIVIAHVRMVKSKSANIFRYNFRIRAPTLNYSYNLFSLQFDENIYPLLMEDVRDYFNDTDALGDIEIKSEEDLLERLKIIFDNNKVRNIVAVLLSQIEED